MNISNSELTAIIADASMIDTKTGHERMTISLPVDVVKAICGELLRERGAPEPAETARGTCVIPSTWTGVQPNKVHFGEDSP